MKPLTPQRNCPLCPRLVEYRQTNRTTQPTWHNAPVPSFGDISAALLVIGLAPGVKGANRTGRPFTGDYAGQLLYTTLLKFGFATGNYAEHPKDGLHLLNCRITNAVRCVPPQNLPTPLENKTCNQFLSAEITAMKNLKAILTLGTVAHTMCLRALNIKASAFKFSHGAFYTPREGLILANSYHVSRYNTSTKRLSTEMFETVVEKLVGQLNNA